MQLLAGRAGQLVTINGCMGDLMVNSECMGTLLLLWFCSAHFWTVTAPLALALAWCGVVWCPTSSQSSLVFLMLSRTHNTTTTIHLHLVLSDNSQSLSLPLSLSLCFKHFIHFIFHIIQQHSSHRFTGIIVSIMKPS